MKSLQEFIAEAKTSNDIYVVYFGDDTMYNFYYDGAEANKERDALNKEMPSNKAYVKKEKKSDIEQ